MSRLGVALAARALSASRLAPAARAAAVAGPSASSAAPAFAPASASASLLGLAPASSRSLSLFVRVHGSPGAALERLQAKSEQEGVERSAAARRRYVKPHLARQKAASDALYNKAKRERVRLVEELVLDRKLVPF